MPRIRSSLALLALALSIVVGGDGAAFSADFPPKDGDRVLFLGDSITQYGLYVRYVEAFLATRLPDRKVEVINLGLSSETLSGFTEEGHPYPRPDVHARLARALEMARPNLAFVCYGMNDGIYHPPSVERLEAYGRGVDSVVEAIRKAGAEVIVGTPPPFDPLPIRSKLAPLSSKKFGYFAPYEDYDGVLGLYSAEILDRRPKGLRVADIHAASLEGLRMFRETAGADYAMAKDGIHPLADGHWLIARPYLEAWGASAEVDAAAIDAADRKVVRGDVRLLEGAADGGLRFDWTTRIPFPHDPNWNPKLVAFERIDDRFNRHTLRVVGLARPRFAIFEGDRKVGEATRHELSEGVSLLRYPDLSTNRRSAQVWPLIEQRHAILRPAWLEAVGHEAPKMPPSPSIEAAARQAAPIEAQIRELCRPVPIALTLKPI